MLQCALQHSIKLRTYRCFNRFPLFELSQISKTILLQKSNSRPSRAAVFSLKFIIAANRPDQDGLLAAFRQFSCAAVGVASAIHAFNLSASLSVSWDDIAVLT